MMSRECILMSRYRQRVADANNLIKGLMLDHDQLKMTIRDGNGC